MSDTSFTNGVTRSDADWFNDLNRLHYTVFGDPTSARAALDALYVKGNDVTSAATLDLTSTTGDYVHVTGTTTITAITLNAGDRRWVVFDGILTLTHNGTSLILPGAANILTAANDAALVMGEGSGNARILAYQRAANFLIPAGALMDFAGTSAPAGWLGCDGSAVSRTTYANLFNSIGTTWGAGDGSSTFNLPDFRRRVAVGSGGSGTATLANSVGSTGGAETHTLTTAEIPAHSHTITLDIQNLSGGAAPNVLVYPGFGIGQLSPGTNNAGGGGAHTIMQPSAVVLKIIKI